MERIKRFLAESLREQINQKRKYQMLKGLYYAENIMCREQNLSRESRNFAINEFTFCAICKRKFTNQSAFVRLPNNEILHISCQGNIKEN